MVTVTLPTRSGIASSYLMVRAVSILGLGIVVGIVLHLVTLRVLTYFHGQNELGVILSLKIFQMAWITIFAMLIFSSMVTAVSTLYLSSDNEIILAAPLPASICIPL